jgi:hypothetical protein
MTKVVMPLAAHPFDMVLDRERLALASVLDHDHVPPGEGGHGHRAPGTGHRATATTLPPANLLGGSSGGTGRCEILFAIGATSLYLADACRTSARPAAWTTIWATRRDGEGNTTCCNTVSFRE